MHKFIVIIIVNIYVQWTKTARHGLDTFRYLCLILMIPQSRWSHFCPYFIDKETEAWRDGKPQPLGALLALPSLGENLISFWSPLNFFSFPVSACLWFSCCYCLLLFFCVWVFCLYVYLRATVCWMPSETRRRHLSWGTKWVPGIKPRSSGRATRALLNHLSSSLCELLCLCLSYCLLFSRLFLSASFPPSV